MSQTYFAGAAALDSHMRIQESIAFNVANVNTPGFKRRVNGSSSQPFSFQAIFQNVRHPVVLPRLKTSVDFSQGDMKQTGNDFDFALEGKGFFKLRTADGIRYTRNGSFRLDPSGQLVNQAGDPVILKESSAPISENGGKLLVGKDGTISQGETKIGRLDVVQVDNLAALVPENGGLFRSEGAAETPSDAQVIQGSLESANVNPIEEMVAMIAVARNFESVQRLIRGVDETVRKAFER